MLEWLQNQGGTYHNFIGGAFVESRNSYTPIYNAANAEQLLGYFPDSSEQEVNEAVDAAERGLSRIAQLSMTERSHIMLRFAELLLRDRQELAYRIAAEQGKVLSEALGEVDRARNEAIFVATEALRVQGLHVPAERAGMHNYVQQVPIGVVAAIAPWNFPVVTPVRKIVPAFIYGCSVVFKPASYTPFAAAKLMELFAEANVPSGAINMIVGSGRIVGKALVAHPKVRGISFTGSTDQGMNIQQVAAARLAKTQLELGGKNAAIVLSADHVAKVAKQIVSAAFGCTGQRCTAISRVIVRSSIKQELTSAIVEEAQKLNIGPAWKESSQMGPLINAQHMESVCTHIKGAIDEGARLLTGGGRMTGGLYDKGNYLEPTIFDHVQSQMKIATEEVFGPVLTIQEVDSVEEAIEVANATKYGLATSIFSTILQEAFAVSNAIQSGMIHINHGTSSAHHLPFGGVKQSGFGAFSIGSTNQQFYTEPKVTYIEY